MNLSGLFQSRKSQRFISPYHDRLTPELSSSCSYRMPVTRFQDQFSKLIAQWSELEIFLVSRRFIQPDDYYFEVQTDTNTKKNNTKLWMVWCQKPSIRGRCYSLPTFRRLWGVFSRHFSRSNQLQSLFLGGLFAVIETLANYNGY